MIDRAYGRQLSCAEQDACERHKAIQVAIAALWDALKAHDENDYYEALLGPLEDARMSDDKIVDLIVQKSEDDAAFDHDAYDRWRDTQDADDFQP